MSTERKLYLLRVQASAVPVSGGPSQGLALPDVVTEELDAEGWHVISHGLMAADLSGDLMLSLYVEREVLTTS